MSIHSVDLIDEIEHQGVVEALMGSPGPMPSLAELLGRPAWQSDAACRGEGAESFFPPEGTSLMRARRICNRCTVADECLQYALERPSMKGIWAGTSERRRRRLRAESLGAGPPGSQEPGAVKDVV